MLYDRPYMRQAGSDRYPLVTTLIVINVVIYGAIALLELSFGKGLISGFFSLSPHNLMSGYLWSALSYAVLHGGPWHLLLNMLGLFFIGTPTYEQLGRRDFLILYIGGALLGGIAWLTLSWDTPMASLVGASAAISAVLIFFCCSHAEETVFLFPIFTLKAKWLGWIFIGIQLIYLPAELSSSSATSYSSHLGGALFGFLFYKFFYKKDTSWIPEFNFSKTSVEKPAPVKKNSAVSFSLNITNKEKLQKEVDRILDKINDHGFASISDDEKRTLDRAKDLLNK